MFNDEEIKHYINQACRGQHFQNQNELQEFQIALPQLIEQSRNNIMKSLFCVEKWILCSGNQSDRSRSTTMRYTYMHSFIIGMYNEDKDLCYNLILGYKKLSWENASKVFRLIKDGFSPKKAYLKWEDENANLHSNSKSPPSADRTQLLVLRSAVVTWNSYLKRCIPLLETQEIPEDYYKDIITLLNNVRNLERKIRKWKRY